MKLLPNLFSTLSLSSRPPLERYPLMNGLIQPVTPLQLAQAGFYRYPSTEDPGQVKCFSCKRQVYKWDPTATFTHEELL